MVMQISVDIFLLLVFKNWFLITNKNVSGILKEVKKIL